MAANTLSALPIPPCYRKVKHFPPFPRSLTLTPYNLVLSSVIGSELSLRSINGRRGVSKHCRPAVATVSLLLPTAKPERTSSEKLPKWSARATRAYSLGQVEAHKLKYPKTGTESLLMGILVEGTSFAAQYLRENGITFYKVREEAINLLGTSVDKYYAPDDPPLTEPAQRAVDWAVDEKLKSGESGEITTTHLFLGIWSEKDYAGHKILETLGFDDEKAKELAKSINVD